GYSRRLRGEIPGALRRRTRRARPGGRRGGAAQGVGPAVRDERPAAVGGPRGTTAAAFRTGGDAASAFPGGARREHAAGLGRGLGRCGASAGGGGPGRLVDRRAGQDLAFLASGPARLTRRGTVGECRNAMPSKLI